MATHRFLCSSSLLFPYPKTPRPSVFPQTEERAALHATQPHRTTLLPSYTLLQNTLLPLWETARQTTSPSNSGAGVTVAERKEAVAQLWSAVKGRVGEVKGGHKGGRILQTVSFGLGRGVAETLARRRL